MVAAWTPATSDPSSIGCTGTPAARFNGPGIWLHATPSVDDIRFDAQFQELIFSASWVDLRTRFPPGSSDTRYLQWQGVQGLIWGKNTWSAASGGTPFPKRSAKQRVNGWTPVGTAYIQPPARSRYPSLYSVNGTNYTRTAEGFYTNDDGLTLNLTLPLQ